MLSAEGRYQTIFWPDPPVPTTLLVPEDVMVVASSKMDNHSISCDKPCVRSSGSSRQFMSLVWSDREPILSGSGDSREPVNRETIVVNWEQMNREPIVVNREPIVVNRIR